MDEKHERTWRRKAIRLTLRGMRPKDIRKQIPRSRRWLWKWQTRYQTLGWRGLKSQSRCPRHSNPRYSGTVRRRVVWIRRRLEQAQVGLIGVTAIQRAWERIYPKQPIPAKSTLYRILHEAGVLRLPHPPEVAYYPQPTATPQFVLFALDWTLRYLEGGPKIYAFHTVTIPTRRLHQTRMVKEGLFCTVDCSTIGSISVPARVLLPVKKYGRVGPSDDRVERP